MLEENKITALWLYKRVPFRWIISGLMIIVTAFIFGYKVKEELIVRSAYPITERIAQLTKDKSGLEREVMVLKQRNTFLNNANQVSEEKIKTALLIQGKNKPVINGCTSIAVKVSKLTKENSSLKKEVIALNQKNAVQKAEQISALKEKDTLLKLVKNRTETKLCTPITTEVYKLKTEKAVLESNIESLKVQISMLEAKQRVDRMSDEEVKKELLKTARNR